MTRRIPPVMLIALLAALLAYPALHATPARADGDPASDVLLGEDVFYPYSPTVSRSLQQTLNAATAKARKAGTPIKIALIASPVDLGVIPDLFGKPQKYADFLIQEISFRGKQPLLVVMKDGYGVQGLTSKADAVVAKLPKPTGKSSDALATAAIAAVAKISAANGHPLSGVPGLPGESSSSSSNTGLIIGLVVAALLTAAALAYVTLRRRKTAT